ncbi:MAG: hypothetical protein OEW87_09400, partial [Flavobacteriaceae bacterium]|nr:hypothetical protein [Flavobacteriaceae bacterium]
RTGKLLSPRFGLFSMILEAHTYFGKNKKPLMFIPVSIAHEHIPEEAAHAKELGGAKKQAEKATQLFKLFTLFNKKMGTVHVRFSEGIVVDDKFEDLKEKTHELAFECFRKVGKGMPITPSSLLSLILLDEPAGAMTWTQIEATVKNILAYCKHMEISLTSSLTEDNALTAVRAAMDMFINNNKVKLIKREKLNQVFYTVTEESRVNLLYHKNMILHHFFVPAIINMTWFNIFNGTIKTELELKRYLLLKRKELKFEFYLPKTKEMIVEGIRIIEYALGREIQGTQEILKCSTEELYQVASLVRNFSSALSYIYEAYYISVVTLKYLEDCEFNEEKFLQVASELFIMEKEHGRVVKYSESCTIPKMKSTIDYLLNQGVIEKDEKKNYRVTDRKKIGHMIEQFAKDLNDQISINLKFKGQEEQL